MNTGEPLNRYVLLLTFSSYSIKSLFAQLHIFSSYVNISTFLNDFPTRYILTSLALDLVVRGVLTTFYT